MDYTLSFCKTFMDEKDEKSTTVLIPAVDDKEALEKANSYLRENYKNGRTLIRPFYPELLLGDRLVASVGQQPNEWFGPLLMVV